MNLRPASAADAALLARLHAAGIDPAWSAEDLAAVLAGPGVFGLIAGEAGMVLCRAVADEMEVLTVVVVPAARRGGVARALMAGAIGLGRQCGAETAFLEVADDNAPARALYADLGFQPAGLRKAYYAKGADAVVMRLDLRAPAP